MSRVPKVVTVPTIHCAPKHTLDLTICFGGTFVHVPVAKYVGGAAFVIKGLSGVHAGEQELKKLVSSYGLSGIKGFYILDGGFIMVRTLKQFVTLYGKAILYGGKLTLYADCCEYPVDDASSHGTASSQFAENAVLGTQASQTGGSKNLVDVDVNVDDLVDVDVEDGPEKEKVEGINVIVEDVSDDEVSHDMDVEVDVVKGVEGVDMQQRKGKKKVGEDDFIDPEYDFREEEEQDGMDYHDHISDCDEEEEEEVVVTSKRGTEPPKVHSSGPSNQRNESYSSDEEYMGEEDIIVDTVDFDQDEEEAEYRSGKKVERVKFSTFSEADLFSPEFRVGTIFTNKETLKTAIASHAQKTHKRLGLTKSDQSRAHYKCKGTPPCSWLLHVQKLRNEDSFVVNKYYPKHACNNTSNISICNSTWLAKRFVSAWACDPKRSIGGMQKQIKAELGVNVSKQQLYRAKKKALTLLYGTEEEQIGLVWDYRNEVLSKNPGSTVLVITIPEENKFDKFYVCLHACKEGFKHCRKIVGLDGCHLNNVFGGVLLTAVGVDPNNNTFPIAWAVVKSESYETWAWFLSCLELDLNMQDHTQWTFMSDKQKGLTKAFEENFAESVNRFCVKHLHGNMKVAGFTGSALKESLWYLATSTTQAQYDIHREEIEQQNPKAAEWLLVRDPKTYCRAFFSTQPKCDMLLNNGCETFNSTILPAREMGLICMMEWIMSYMMTRFQKNRDMAESKWKSKVCPRIRNIIATNTENRTGCFAVKSTSDLWSVETSFGDKYTVNLGNWTCGCRKWELSGIPCRHAITCILDCEKDPEDFVDSCYWVSTYKRAYEPAVVPLNGRKEWVKTGILKPLPPNEGRAAGRPNRLRKRAADEPSNKAKKGQPGRPNQPLSKFNKYKMKRQQTTVKCSYCGEFGHNRQTCSKKMAEEAASLHTEVFSFTKASNLEEGGTSKTAKGRPKGRAPKIPKQKAGQGQATTSNANPFKQQGQSSNVGTSMASQSTSVSKPASRLVLPMQPQPPPNQWQQQESQGLINAATYSKNIKVQGATVHMKKTPPNVITRAKLIQMKKQAVQK